MFIYSSKTLYLHIETCTEKRRLNNSKQAIKCSLIDNFTTVQWWAFGARIVWIVQF